MKGFLVCLVLFVAMTWQPANAMPISYDFSQAGYAQGASVTGTFVGEDLDGNGQLSSFAGEIFGFTLQFSGNAFLSAFSLDIADLFGLVYDLDGGALGDGTGLHREGILAFNWDSLFAVGPGPIHRVCGVGINCAVVADQYGAAFSSQLVQVSANVPEPASIVLFMIGFAGLLLARRMGKTSS